MSNVPALRAGLHWAAPTALTRRQNIKAADAHSKAGNGNNEASFEHMQRKVMRSEAIGQAKTELLAEEDDLEERVARLGKEDEINRILNELKAKKGA